MNIRSVVKGAMTFVPGMERLLPKPIAGNNPPSSYFYGVWLKHVAFLAENGLYGPPRTVAELGPGDTLGLGIAALLSGADRYYGLDIIAHTTREANLKVLDELVPFFQKRAARPTKGFPDFDHMLDERLFPGRIITDEALASALRPERIEHIRRALASPAGKSEGITLGYKVPWSDATVVEENSVDLIVSQAVLEHVADIDETYHALYRWLKPGGVMSHQIDFRSHNLAKEWNGHRAIPEPIWKVMMGNRTYFINRQPWSEHCRAISNCGFEIVCALKLDRADGIPRARHAKKWRELSEEDIACAEVFVQARKPIASKA